MKLFVPVVLAMSLFTGNAAFGQEATSAAEGAPAENALSLVRDNLLYMKGGFSAGFYQNGREVTFGFFGRNMDQIFGEYPDALASARSARTFMIVGGALTTV